MKKSSLTIVSNLSTFASNLLSSTSNLLFTRNLSPLYYDENKCIWLTIWLLNLLLTPYQVCNAIICEK